MSDVYEQARKLDAIDPLWYTPERIDLDLFDVNTYTKCVIGQSFAGMRGLDSCTSEGLAKAIEFIDDHGLDAGTFASHKAGWKRLIQRRRNEALQSAMHFGTSALLPGTHAELIAKIAQGGAQKALDANAKSYATNAAQNMRDGDYSAARRNLDKAEALQEAAKTYSG